MENRQFNYPIWEYKQNISIEYVLSDVQYELLLKEHIFFTVIVRYMTENGAKISEYTEIDVFPTMKMGDQQAFGTSHGLFEDLNEIEY
ncbi:hypothetical protein D3C80_1584730 [compost metagenome]